MERIRASAVHDAHRVHAVENNDDDLFEIVETALVFSGDMITADNGVFTISDSQQSQSVLARKM